MSKLFQHWLLAMLMLPAGSSAVMPFYGMGSLAMKAVLVKILIVWGVSAE
jgi:hypothetical protein